MQKHIKTLLQKFQAIYFENKLLMNKLLGLPAQTNKEIKIFEKILVSFMPEKRIKIFEWGSGLSTIYYAKYLKKRDMVFEWHSIDNNKTWHEIVKTKLEKEKLSHCVKVYLKEFPSFWEKPNWGPIPPLCGVFGPNTENEKSYIAFPKILNDKFNIVIIDARFRRYCIRVARDVLAASGVVILHDAQKTHYHGGLKNFRFGRFIRSGSWYPFQKVPNKIWVGTMENSKIFEVLKQF